MFRVTINRYRFRFDVSYLMIDYNRLGFYLGLEENSRVYHIAHSVRVSASKVSINYLLLLNLQVIKPSIGAIDYIDPLGEQQTDIKLSQKFLESWRLVFQCIHDGNEFV